MSVKRKKVNRFRWLEKQVKIHGFTRGAEVGCEGGRTTSYLLRNCHHLTLYAVDMWGEVPEQLRSDQYNYYLKDHDAILRQFNKVTMAYRDRLIVLRGISWEMAEEVEDESLDFVFIDADHGYEAVMKDIRAWYPKVRQGGLISGHDYDPDHPDVLGVIRAVDECFGKENISLTTYDHVWYVWK